MQSVRGLRQCGGELVQFAVDFNAQRTEDAFGGIARRAVGLRHHFIDQTVELCGGGKRLLVSTRHDGAGDLTRETLFTVFLEYADQFRRIIVARIRSAVNGWLTSMRISSGASCE